MIVVTSILAMMAALIIPNMVAFKTGRDIRDQEAAILRMPLQARNEAMKSGAPVTLHFEGDDLIMEREPVGSTVDSNGNVVAPPAVAASTGATATATPSSSQGDTSTALEIKRLTIGGEVSVTSAQLTTSANPAAAVATTAVGTVDPASWRWTVYPDGTQDGGGLTFRIGKTQMSLVIPGGDGLTAAHWVQGELPQDQEDKWTAGDLQQRS